MWRSLDRLAGLSLVAVVAACGGSSFSAADGDGGRGAAGGSGKGGAGGGSGSGTGGSATGGSGTGGSGTGGSATGGSGGGAASSGTGGTGASSGTGGMAGSGGSGGTGTGGGPSVCGTGPCTEGDTCTDGACCPCLWECVGGVWQMQACAGCAVPGCPIEPPAHDEPCDVCGAPSFPCQYNLCATGQGQITTQCLADASGSYTWQQIVEPCSAAPPCGDDATAAPCPDGLFCVRHEITIGPAVEVSYSCADNPCPDAPDCNCGQEVCSAVSPFSECIDVSQYLLKCATLTQ